ncbi:LapA family protein [candidate division WOR-3 bacterium]|nr:LapA family protein [candidate division WOR-3 bacterium]
MYLFAIILIALFAIFGIIFGVQNAAPVEVHFFANEFTTPLVLVMIISFAGGAILAFVLAIVDEIKLRGKIGKQQREIDTLKKELGTIKTMPEQEEKNED